MKKRTLVSIALTVAFVLALAAPVFAQSINYSAEYNFDGTIEQEMQAGHLCNTGAELKQTIMGTGAMTKVMDVAMVQGKIAVSDVNDWVTSPNAVRNLTVTSVIELCTPPKMTYETDIGVPLGLSREGVVHPAAWYLPAAGFTMPRFWGPGGWSGYNTPQEAIIEEGTLWPTDYERLTKQIWAVQVEAAAGFSGALHQNFEAAYGPFEGYVPVGDFLADPVLANHLSDDPDFLSDHWTWGLNADGAVVVIQGDDYVGDYFKIDQFARTSQGVVKRYIDVSSPWSHGYLMVDSSITGRVEATDKFSMDNIEAGSDADDNWWVLF